MYNLFNKQGNGILSTINIKEALTYVDRDGYSLKVGRWVSKNDRHYYATWLCVNKQLEPYNMTYHDVSHKGNYQFLRRRVRVKKLALWGLIKYNGWKEEEIPWYQFFTFKAQEDFENWKAFCITTFRKILGMTKQEAEVKFEWFNLKYGLKQDYAAINK